MHKVMRSFYSVEKIKPRKVLGLYFGHNKRMTLSWVLCNHDLTSFLIKPNYGMTETLYF